MQKRLSLSLLAITSVGLGSALGQGSMPEGGGSYSPPVGICLSGEQRAEIDSMLARNVRQLISQGLLPAEPARPEAAVLLDWPLRQAAGFKYNSIYGVSNFVDHNPAIGKRQDWNCNTRTYDSGNYNHAGTDIFLWPFDQNMMESGQAQIIAAAPGVIIGRFDGNFDLNCALSNANWNAVYLRHTDGSVTWYGHMKTGSVTSKQLGATVAAGEVLGTVGSSGSSTGPHLHFELHDAQGKVVDPYTGPCGPATSSWVAQKPYYEPTVNSILTHQQAPVFEACPKPDQTNLSDNLTAGETAYFAAYYHDQGQGQASTYTVYRPDNTVFSTWTHSSSAAHYAASYWYWSLKMPTTAVPGNWRFEVAYEGTVVKHEFTVGQVVTALTKARQAAAFTLAPNPAQHRATLTLAGQPAAGAEVTIRTMLGQVVSRQPLAARLTELALPASPGLYLVTLPTTEGPATQKLLIE